MSTAQAESETPQSYRPWRVATILGLSLPIFAWVVSRSPLAQDLTYHVFADQRALYGVAHFWNVASNLPFAVIGVLGCSLPAKIAETLYPLEISVEGGEVSGR